MSKTAQFTPEQMKHFEAYEDVRARGHFNMFDPRARMITGLSREDFLFVMDNFEALQHQHREQAA